ncbi:Lrp/AsnC family transcriptional regulator [Jiella sp. MQZ9-1]|uniref:Lrp/AsnC family transcriptional regulator n=1 Tax=Jiella flava TaxID=2816857 RepID=A0A939G2G4_9HYPH|nr:Lrp/AsnC family transcriptional regulator [Jiella flava]MBO0663992.1 Lrp/AsnC family transcriptional regulator [Jiella flava]MCD2472563.1 Lrp/AsnC family transcriptional regulator [Jiella flava]
MSALDRFDLAIMRALGREGRLTVAALGDKVGLSASACSRRLERLEATGAIKGYRARLSNQALGHAVTVMVAITLAGQSERQLAEFEAAVRQCPNVLACFLMSGEADYILRIAARDLEDYERIHRRYLSAFPHVARINSSFALREVLDRDSVLIDALSY